MRNRFIRSLLACALFVLSTLGQAQNSASVPTSIDLATEPLFSGRANIHPNLLLSLSVEFPTVGVAYRGNYARNTEYVGYYNSKKCYVYSQSNRTLTDAAYFQISENADSNHECTNAFSGNFLNWATSSAIDMLRFALTGGDRVIDTTSLTVLQRAVLPDSFYASGSYFPRRTVTNTAGGSAPNKITPFNVSTLYVVSCRNRILFSDRSSGVSGSAEYCTSTYNGSGSPSNAARDKVLGEYLARVRVCAADEATERSDLCIRYGGHYKPAGELQRNAGRVRVGAMGYLLDDAASRYGGVLRAPIKYLGATQFLAPNFLSETNDRPEWDAQTGIFYNNPEDSSNRNSATNSGVINYLNKFGRSGTYKTIDPVSELYYEGIRYLQGKQPTSAATSNMTTEMRDQFPVITSWTDPITAECQRNYILTIADANTHWDRYIPGNTRTNNDTARSAEAATATHPALDVRTWTEQVGEMEVDANRTYANPNRNSALTNLHTRDTGSGTNGTYYISGLAYWANTNPIRLDKPVSVKTFVVDVDEGGNGQIDSNTRGNAQPRSSQLYLAAKYGGFNDRNGDGNPFITLASDGITTLRGDNSEWDNGAGVPANYFLAGQPKPMIDAVRKIFATISATSGTISGVGITSSLVSNGEPYVFQPGFDSTRWSGSLKKRRVLFDATYGVSIEGNVVWDAAEVLTGRVGTTPAVVWSDRKIYTAGGTGDSAGTREFSWTGLTAEQRSALNVDPVTQATDALGERRLNFIRGERTHEIGETGGTLRRRDSLLGDIVNSNPVYVGPPAARSLGSSYATFQKNNAARTPAVYIGANDGMLHAFSSDDGRELFAYIPDALIEHLPKLTDPAYVHRPFVDGQLHASEAQIGSTWKTVLIGGFGGGVQGVFALDITDPTAFGSGLGSIFEFTDKDDADMGNVLGAPEIARFRTGTVNGQPQYRYFAVVASGANNYKDDGESRFNTDAAGALFLLSLEKRPDEAWELGSNYFKLRLPARDTSATSRANGLSQPALIVGVDGAIKHAYLGDYQGQLWRVDFSLNAAQNLTWSAAVVFLARDNETPPQHQPISTVPRVVFAPGGGYIVLFGTGKYMENSDISPATFSPQSFYAFYDTVTGSSTYTRSAMVQATLTPQGNGFTFSVPEVRLAANGNRGWYMDFYDATNTGERLVTNPVVLDGTVYFNSLVPGRNSCATGGGRSYALSILTGRPRVTITGINSPVGLLGSPLVLDLGADAKPRNAIGGRVVDRRYGVVGFGTDGVANTGDGITTLRAGRLSWREVENWR